jgi:AbrB family looped-hinge helix DNA binding protein
MTVKTHAIKVGRQAMPISKLGQRRQVVIPKEICDELGLQEGDFVEVSRVEGQVIIKPKKLVDADDVLTPEEEKVVRKREAQLKKGQHVSGMHTPA